MVEQKKKNEQSLGELNNFLDLTNTLCDPADDTSSSIGNDHLNASSVSKFGINQTNYKFFSMYLYRITILILTKMMIIII